MQVPQYSQSRHRTVGATWTKLLHVSLAPSKQHKGKQECIAGFVNLYEVVLQSESCMHGIC
eukprot:6466156-Amphidinium_carterae.1